MKPSSLPLLGHALLGLLSAQPASGYDLRRIFTDTPMSTFSDSPGSIYPALTRLERAGLIEGTIEPSGGLRLRRRYALTAAGRDALDRWLTSPIAREDVVKRLDGVLLRFAFLDQTGHGGRAAGLLAEFRAQLAAYIDELRAHLRTFGPEMTASGRLALENGLWTYEAHLRWTLHAAATHPGEKTP